LHHLDQWFAVWSMSPTTGVIRRGLLTSSSSRVAYPRIVTDPTILIAFRRSGVRFPSAPPVRSSSYEMYSIVLAAGPGLGCGDPATAGQSSTLPTSFLVPNVSRHDQANRIRNFPAGHGSKWWVRVSPRCCGGAWMLSIWSNLADLPDPRNGNARWPNLLVVLTIALPRRFVGRRVVSILPTSRETARRCCANFLNCRAVGPVTTPSPNYFVCSSRPPSPVASPGSSKGWVRAAAA
jgi:hypothetical protein